VPLRSNPYEPYIHQNHKKQRTERHPSFLIEVKIMKKYYVWDVNTKFYAGSIMCRDGMNPKNSTDIEPLPFKANNEIKWNGSAWVYQTM
jgi:hypothetical protein